jgi:hypothetical protein
MRVLNAMKTFTMVATLLAGGTTLAMAQNGLPTGDETPVAGGANGGGIAYGTVYAIPTNFGPRGICTPISLPALTDTDIEIIDRSGEGELCLARLSSPFLPPLRPAMCSCVPVKLLGLLKIGP